MFGGIDQNNNPSNDLFILTPFYDENEKILGPSTLDYAAQPTLSLELSKVTKYSGRAPNPRISHSAMMFKDKNK